MITRVSIEDDFTLEIELSLENEEVLYFSLKKEKLLKILKLKKLDYLNLLFYDL